MARLDVKRPEWRVERWKWPLRAASLLVFALTWEALARTMHSLLLPTFTGAMAALARLLTQAETWQAIWISNQALMLGYALTVSAGVPLGLLLGRSPRLGRLADPYLNTLLVTPISALIPLFIVATGLGLTSRVLVVFAFSFVVVTVNTQAGLRHVEPTLIEMARSFGATEGQLWGKVLLPGALPAVMAGLRLGLGRAITGMVNVELLLTAAGLGLLILRYQADFESDFVYAVILVVVAEAVVFMGGIKQLERRLTSWESDTPVR